MRTLSSSLITVALISGTLACNPATHGIGDAEDAEAFGTGETGVSEGDAEGGDGDGDSSADGEGDGDGDGDGEQSCVDPQLDVDVAIELIGPSYPAGDCTENVVTAEVTDAVEGSFTMTRCPCGEPQCEGEEFELVLEQADPSWLPALEIGACYYFHVFTEESQPDVCHVSRLDIYTNKDQPLWYSTGWASEDLDHNGLAVTPVITQACADECGDWELRDAIFSANGAETSLGWGEAGIIGTYYEATHWRSYAVEPLACEGMASADVTAWTVRVKG